MSNEEENTRSDSNAAVIFGGMSITNSTMPELQPLPRAAELLFGTTTEQKRMYWDKSHYPSIESQRDALEKSSTLYIGNLAFSTRSQHIWSHFSQIGPLRQVIMGVDRYTRTPCGFCFVEYCDREDALCAVAHLSSTKLDGRVIRVDLDAGYQESREFGRGPSGGQMRDDRRISEDSGRQHKRHKPLNWTPPEHVRQQQQQQEPNATSEATHSDMATEAQPAPAQMTSDMGQESNPRFRDQ